MPNSGKRISLQDVAQAAGVHVSTVSLALRDDPRLSEATRAKVKAVADKLGYRQNPLVSAWLRHVRHPEVAHEGVGMAFLLGHTCSQSVRDEPYYQILVDGARAEAKALGYVVSELEYGKDDEARLLKEVARLRYRGVRGVLIFDPQELLTPRVIRELEEGFAVVVLLRCGGNHRFHRVGTDIVGNVTMALNRLRDLGCRRIGLPVYPVIQTDRVRRDAMCAFLLAQQQWPKSDRVPAPDHIIEFSETEFIGWLRKEKPDAILSVNFGLYKHLTASGYVVPRDLYFAHIGVDARNWLMGVINRGFEVGRASVFQLAGLLTGNRFSVPEFPLSTLLPGIWNDPGTDSQSMPTEVAESSSPSQPAKRPAKKPAKARR